MEGASDGLCEEHGDLQERPTTVSDPIEVTCAPKYNVSLYVTNGSSGVMDFDLGLSTAPNAGLGSIYGCDGRIGLLLSAWQPDASKGVKGLEVPQPGTAISFDIRLDSNYYINVPADDSYTAGETVSIMDGYLPRLFVGGGYPGGNYEAGASDVYGRPWDRPMDSRFSALLPVNGHLPWEWSERESAACHDGGLWKFEQEGDVLHVTIEDLEVDLFDIPLVAHLSGGQQFGAVNGRYVAPLGSGVCMFLHPFSRLGENQDSSEPELLTEYGQGSIQFSATVENFRLTTISNEICDREELLLDNSDAMGLELKMAGEFHNRIGYRRTDSDLGVGVDSNRDGRDYAMVKDRFMIQAGFTYQPSESETAFGCGWNFMRLSAKLTESLPDLPDVSRYGRDGSDPILWFGALPDGQDWPTYEDMQMAKEDDLIWYQTLGDLRDDGKSCVAILYLDDDPAPDGQMDYQYRIKDISIAKDVPVGTTFPILSTSRLWYLDHQWDMKHWDASTALSFESLPPVDQHSSNCEEDLYWYEPAKYNDDGFVSDHNSDWNHYGDTLLCVGCHVGVNQELLEKDGGSIKESFDTAYGQQYVDFSIRVSATGTHDISDLDKDRVVPVVLEDVLPPGMVYVPGSAKLGDGPYIQAEPVGSAPGVFEGSELLEPIVTIDENGQYHLKWSLEVPLWYPVTIRLSAKIDRKLEAGTHQMEASANVFCSEDLSEHKKESNAGFLVVRSKSSAYGKEAIQSFVDGDTASWLIYADNNGEGDSEVFLRDVSPSLIDGVKCLRLTTFTADSTKCDLSRISIYYSMEESVLDTMDDLDETLLASDPRWKKATITADGQIQLSVSDETPIVPQAWVAVGTLHRGESLEILESVQAQWDMDADRIIRGPFTMTNTLYVEDTPIHREVTSVWRTLSGVVWLDENQDGVRQDAERLVSSNIRFRLMQVDKNGLRTPFLLPDGAEAVVPLGETLLVSGPSAGVSEPLQMGQWKFEGLPEGNFYVEASGSGLQTLSDGSKVERTYRDLGADTQDSDFAVSKDTTDVWYSYTPVNIPNVVGLGSSRYDVTDVDLGLCRVLTISAQKVDAKTKDGLSGATFQLSMDGVSNPLSFYADKNGSYRFPSRVRDFSGDLDEKMVWLSGKSLSLGWFVNPYDANLSDYPKLKYWDRTVPGWFAFEMQEESDGFSLINKESQTQVAVDMVTNGSRVFMAPAGSKSKESFLAMPDLSESMGTVYLQAAGAAGTNDGFVEIPGGNASEWMPLHLWNQMDMGGGSWCPILLEDSESVIDLESGPDGRLEISGLLPGTYRLVETKAPFGYEKQGPWIIHVDSDGTISVTDGDMVDGTVLLPNLRNGLMPAAGAYGFLCSKFGYVIFGIGCVGVLWLRVRCRTT